MRRLVKLFFFLTLSAGLALFLAGTTWLLPRSSRFRYRCRFMTLWGRAVRRLLELDVDARGPIRGGGPFLLVANHLGYLDIAVLAGLMPFSFVSKSEVAGWPVLGFMARAAGTLFVDRNNRLAAKDFADAVGNRLRGGENVLIFPEGTSSRGESVLPFKSVPFASVEKASWAAVIPVAIELVSVDGREAVGETRDVACWHGDMEFAGHFFRFLGLRGARFRVVVGMPVPCAGLDRKVLARLAHERVTDMKAAPP